MDWAEGVRQIQGWRCVQSMYNLSVSAQAMWGGMTPSYMSSEEACAGHVEEEVHRDLEGPSTNVSLKQNSSSGVGADVEGKQSWRNWPGRSDLTL